MGISKAKHLGDFLVEGAWLLSVFAPLRTQRDVMLTSETQLRGCEIDRHGECSVW
jgi:hypothetical protein